MAKIGKVRALPDRSGEKWKFVSSSVKGELCPMAVMFSEEAWQEIARSLKLTVREFQIVRGVFADHTEFTIADDLKVSPHTVHTYCERLYRKLAVTDRIELVLRVTGEFLALTAAPESVLPSICARRTAGRCRWYSV